MLQSRGRFARQPRRVANDQIGTPRRFGRKQIGPDHVDAIQKPQPAQVFACASQGRLVQVRRDHALDAAPGEQCGEHAGPSTDIKSELGFRQRRSCGEFDIFGAHRREHTVVRMNTHSVAQHVHPFAPPLMRADHAKQFAQ
ncbi:MAG: hypothetical protein A3G25_20745 [Betaproteobacteria bacterium RIFCSPLOWO2_12_FULL_63_13]|nr:MAG: hypothetical protein A3G25_20745 [Betaproteobacteria bacterium RIFCSPLOWO2_12_FULL_63_13]